VVDDLRESAPLRGYKAADAAHGADGRMALSGLIVARQSTAATMAGQMALETGTVSAIIPAFNAEAYVAEAIESVLSQTYEPIECIVVDDGSLDATAEVVRGFGPKVILVQQANAGIAGARNRGAAAASGEYLAFLDADDRWRPDRIQAQIEALSQTPNADAVVCGSQVVDESLRPLGAIVQDPAVTVEDMLLCRATLVSSSSNLLIRRRRFDELGGWDSRLPGSEDWAMTFSLVQRGQLISIPELLVEYRVHGSNMSAHAERLERDMLQAYGQIFENGETPAELRPLRRRAYANLHRMIAGAYFVERRPLRFAKHALASIATHPSTLGYFLATPRRRRAEARAQDPFGMARSAKRQSG
jgi:glycosyltransferase involved in cell wall biosynthesis